MVDKDNSLITVSKMPYNAGTPLSALVEDVTPVDLVYVRNHFEVPQINVDEWSLDVGGVNNQGISLSYDEIRALPSKTITLTLECAGNGRKSMNPVPKGTAWGYGAVSVVEFTGTSLRHVLEKADIPKETVEVDFHGADQGEVEPNRIEKYRRSLPIDVSLEPDIILAWDMNGEPLSPNHGYPIRLVVPGWYGMASVKWLDKINFLLKPFTGFFQNEHYVYSDERGTEQGAPVQHIRPRSLILSPENNDTVDKKGIEITGIAWSGVAEIAQVSISVDGGSSWLNTNLTSPMSEYGVQKWWFDWTPISSGKFTILARATDKRGNSQPVNQIWNRLGYGNNGPHKISVFVP